MLGRRDTALTIALRSYQARHFSSCRKACQDVLDHDPRDAVALHLLGMSAFSEKNLDEAIGYLVEAASAEPSSLEIRTNLGLALRVAGRLEAAEEQFRLALSQAPDTPSLMNELALTLIDQERMGEAEGMLERAAILAPGQADVRNSLGILRLRQRRFMEAENYLIKALEIDPNYAEAHLNMGVTLRERGEASDAVGFISRAAELKPSSAEIAVQLGVTLREAGRKEEAALCFERAIGLDPSHPDAWNNLGISRVEEGRLAEGEGLLERAAELRPGFVSALTNLGVARHAQAKMTESLEVFDQALNLDPDWVDAHWNRALALLAMGRQEEGLADYEWRWKLPRFQEFRRDRIAPRWDGTITPGARLLLHAEQGLGDAIQFARFAPELARQGMGVVLEVHGPLVRLFQGRWPGVEVVRLGSPLPPVEAQIPLLSLSGVWKQPLPLPPYLEPDPAMVEVWEKHFGKRKGLRVGLCWQGSPTNSMDARRSLALKTLRPLSKIPGVRMVCLQKGESRDQIQDAGLSFVADLGPELGDFPETVALMSVLDAVVSVDTATAHLAGAVGCPTYTLLSRVPDWRWGLAGDTTPWYPDMTLRRQTDDGDWSCPVAEVVADLKALTD
ncbi:MAG: hypothetical protein A2516_10815 [Alphaproteobacteria bacterium RIFOXYD12_FULL_60_8]|nr:MAG: hypothetical protein A2516_10815 [Alphaproteobacteria bacterium RIFOXYD12_FULL_60_8]